VEYQQFCGPSHALYLKSTDVGPRDPALLGPHTGLRAQYLLDQTATVPEALELMDGVQLVMVGANLGAHVRARLQR
jgi:choloylglycine hydrolase